MVNGFKQFLLDGRGNRAQVRRHKVRQPLGWRTLVATSSLAACPFHHPLEIKGAQGAAVSLGIQVLLTYRGNDAAVGPGAVAFGKTHAIGSEVAEFAHAGNNLSAGAHAKAEEIARAMSNDAVIRGAEEIFQLGHAILSGEVIPLRA